MSIKFCVLSSSLALSTSFEDLIADLAVSDGALLSGGFI